MFDVASSSVGLLFLTPGLLLLAVVIKATSEGSIFYRGRRVGLRGKYFRIYKFRSMVTNAEAIGGSSTSDSDPRITAVGKLMRKFKFDELPQLLNVLVGDMSLVGPRPQVADYVARYSDEEKEVLNVRPGITDWASIWNSDEGAVLARYPDPDKAYDEIIHPTKMQLQLKYAHEHTFRGDLKILAATLICLVRRGWIPAEIRGYARPGESSSQAKSSFTTVTETPGTPINEEQLAMLHTRYAWAGEFAAGKDVLEVACGSGIGLGHLATRAKRVVGGDYDPQLVEIGRRTYGERIDVSAMDAQSLPFEAGTFDVVLLFEAIYYLPHPERFLLESHRVLRPGGTVLICSANCERPEFNMSPFSNRYFSARELSKLLQQHGFQAEVYAGFPLTVGGVVDRFRNNVRAVAVKLHLMPKTMRWKARIKRLFFRTLQEMPAALGKDLQKVEPLLQVDAHQPVSGFKVIYAVGKREAVQQRIAA
jgi:lipopolysaccharide/colanic/teichoic acid biosynthesis glycosyltransferase/SAM-dependent methyltransferase